MLFVIENGIITFQITSTQQCLYTEQPGGTELLLYILEECFLVIGN
jgi:hypothetical protein